MAAQTYGKHYGLPVAVTRCANYFGGFDFNFTRLVAGVAKSVFDGKRPVLRSDGRFTRDFLYIEDAVDIQLMLAERLATDRLLYGEAFNFSYGTQLEVIEIARRIARLMGTNLEPIAETCRPRFGTCTCLLRRLSTGLAGGRVSVLTRACSSQFGGTWTPSRSGWVLRGEPATPRPISASRR